MVQMKSGNRAVLDVQQRCHSTLPSLFTAGVVHWQHPSFFAYFGANVSAPAMLADMWSSAINMIGFSWAAAPVSTELEMVGGQMDRHSVYG